MALTLTGSAAGQRTTMLLLPYSTDAPIYHLPFATIGTMLVNIFLYVFVVALPEDRQEFVVSWLILTFGNFNPITWLTCNYMHANFLHLLGNMIFLWIFGLIVEGKIGWWKFLIVYNLIGIAHGFVMQMATIFFSEGGALGASAAIYGLMSLVMLWAPVNTIHTLLIIGFGLFFTVRTLDVPSYFYVGFNLIVQFFFASIAVIFAANAGNALVAITSETLHLTGAVVGVAVGLFMLKHKLVDCENYDAFSVYEGRHVKSREELAQDYVQSAEGQKKISEIRQAGTEKVRQYLAAGEMSAAWAAYKRAVNQFPGWQLPENDLLQLIGGLRKAGMWDETITLMVAFLRTYPQRDTAVRLALAQILLDKKQRGRQAYTVLEKIKPQALDPRQVQLWENFRNKAYAMAEDDPYEVAAEDW
jgi:membrane associated rhomboid family serine protease